MIDAHLHFGDPGRLEELSAYCRDFGLEGIACLSLPHPAAPGTLDPETLLAKARLEVPVWAFGSLFWPGVTDLVSPANGISGAGAAIAGYSTTSSAATRTSAVGISDAGASPARISAAGTVAAGTAASGPVPEILAAQVSLMAAAGFDGIKIWTGKPSFSAALGPERVDAGLQAILSVAECQGMPVIAHMADPEEFWETGGQYAGRTGGNTNGSFEDFIHRAGAIPEAYPELSVVYPHLLFLAGRLDRLAGILDARPQVFLDLAPGRYFYAPLSGNRGRAREFFAAYADRITIGSDGFFFPGGVGGFPAVDAEENRRRWEGLIGFLATDAEMANPFPPTAVSVPVLRGLSLPKEVVETMGSVTPRRVYGERPRVLDYSAAEERMENLAVRLEAEAVAVDEIERVEDVEGTVGSVGGHGDGDDRGGSGMKANWLARARVIRSYRGTI